MQNMGVGRGMKVGKESIFGAMAALQAWSVRDHDAVRQRETEHLERWKQALAGFEGVDAKRVPDPTGNPLERLEVHVDRDAAGASAAAVAKALAGSEPAIVVRDHELELGFFQLDPCNLAAGQCEIVAKELDRVFSRAAAEGLPEPDLNEVRNGPAYAYRNWLT